MAQTFPSAQIVNRFFPSQIWWRRGRARYLSHGSESKDQHTNWILSSWCRQGLIGAGADVQWSIDIHIVGNRMAIRLQ